MAALIEPDDVRLVVARFPWQRAIGLIGRRSIAPDEGLLLPRCCAVHTVGMRFPIDVVFLDRNGAVMRVQHAVRPLRFLVCRGARSVVELSGGTADRLALVIGESLAISVPRRGTARLRAKRPARHACANTLSSTRG